jgi:hypothetical protein
MRLVGWLFRGEIQKLSALQGQLTCSAYVQGVRDGYHGAADMLSVLGHTREADVTMIRAAGQHVVDGLEQRGHWPATRIETLN